MSRMLEQRRTKPMHQMLCLMLHQERRSVIFCLLHFCQCHVNLFGFAGTDISQRDRIPSLVLVLDCVQFFCGADRLILNAGDNITRL